MPRKTIRRNLAYDMERRLYYAVFRENGRRYARTYHTLREAAEALEGAPPPGRTCKLDQWMTYWLEEVVARDRAESTVYGCRNMAVCHILPVLGHNSIAVTGNIYTHLFDETQTQAVTLVGRGIEGVRERVSPGAHPSVPGSAPECPR